MNTQLLKDLARHQTWADRMHWKALHESSQLLEDAEIRERLNHMIMALRMLTALAQCQTPDPSGMNKVTAAGELEAGLEKANADLIAALESIDLQTMIPLPRGPKGPWEAPAWVLLLQAITHSQHHRAQNASRMRQLGAAPPMTDFVVWYGIGQP